MPSLAATIRQAEEILDDILRLIRQESESINPALTELDQNSFVDEEQRLRNRFQRTLKSESKSWSLQNLIGLPSPQAAMCLEDAEGLRKRVKESINAEVRKRTTGRGSAPASSFFNFMGKRTPEDSGLPLPLVDRISQWNFEAPIHNENNVGDNSPRHSHYVGLPASPLPQPRRWSGTIRSSSNSPSTLSAQLPLDPPSAPPVAWDVNAAASSADRQARTHGQQESWDSGDHTTKTNCVDIRNGSNVTGLTLNNGGTKNSGAVVHMVPQRTPHIAHLR